MRPRPTHRVQRDVEDFHRALNIPVGDTPAVRRAELRASLIAEEARELLEAITGQEWDVKPTTGISSYGPLSDFVGAIDGMCDLLCVVYGTAAEFGVDLAPFWDEVHRSNMAKRGGPTRADGKKLKPEGWAPPNIAGILDDVMDAAAWNIRPKWRQR